MKLVGMNKRNPSLFLCLIIAFVATISFPADAFGQRGGRSGGFRSSPSRSAPAKPSRSKSATASKNQSRSDKATPTNNGKSWGSSKSATPNKQAAAAKKRQTAADRALHDRAKKQGTHFQSRQQATEAFTKTKGPKLRQKHPVTFDKEPATRPSYIPQTHTAGGTTYNVTYNQDRGGFGYTDALGMFILYDVMTNDSFVNNQMKSSGYAYGPPPKSGVNVAIVVGVIIFIIYVITR